jgi:hypothetical protein
MLLPISSANFWSWNLVNSTISDNFINRFGTLCSQEVTHRRILFEENKRKFIGYNPDEKPVIRVVIDGCLMTTGIRCDFLLVEKEKHLGCFIELKGSDIDHALDQLQTTINQIDSPSGTFISKKFSKRFAFVVSSQVPQTTTGIQNKMKNFAKQGIVLKIKNNQIIFDLKKEEIIDKF